MSEKGKFDVILDGLFLIDFFYSDLLLLRVIGDSWILSIPGDMAIIPVVVVVLTPSIALYHGYLLVIDLVLPSLDREIVSPLRKDICLVLSLVRLLLQLLVHFIYYLKKVILVLDELRDKLYWRHGGVNTHH